MLNKEFTYKGIVITRGDYESMPCPMYAHEFNDEKMEELVKYIYDTLRVCYGYDEMLIVLLTLSQTKTFLMRLTDLKKNSLKLWKLVLSI